MIIFNFVQAAHWHGRAYKVKYDFYFPFFDRIRKYELLIPFSDYIISKKRLKFVAMNVGHEQEYPIDFWFVTDMNPRG